MLGSFTKENETFAVLPLRDIVVFPHMIVPLFVGREKSVKALEHVMTGSKKILLVTQRSPSEDDPTSDDIHLIGTVGSILQLLKLPDGTVKVLVEGLERVKITSFTDKPDFIEAHVEPMADETVKDEEVWMDDGNIIVSGGTNPRTMFKCHRSILSTRSDIFSDVFTLPASSANELYEGLPVVHLPDAAADVKQLLRILYDPRCVGAIRLSFDISHDMS